MDFWIKPGECTGCTACKQVCPVGAIDMKKDKRTGFEYPWIDSNKCIGCNKCAKTCPVLKKIEKKKQVQTVDYGLFGVYAVRHKNEEIRFESTSGGFFSELASLCIENGMTVYGAAYGENLKVYHKGITSKEEIYELRQSKYVQSSLEDSFAEVREKIEGNQAVLFVGSPCQVAGLYEYLGNIPDKLITVEFICLGVNAPRAYEEWISELEKTNSSKIRRIWFKYKDLGWRESPFTTKVVFQNGREIVLRKNDNFFMKGYLSGNLFLRDSCCDCKYVGDKRCADITIGDYWGSDDFDDDMGTSIVILNTKKGADIFRKIDKRLSADQISRDMVVEGNPHFACPAKRNPNTPKFFDYLDNHSFSIAVKKYTRKRLSIRIRNKITKVLSQYKGK